MWAAGRHNCAAVTGRDLEGITSLDFRSFRNTGIQTLYHDDFAGLLNLDSLELHNYGLRELPSSLFSSLRNLTYLNLTGGCSRCRVTNHISDLPPGVFHGLSNLRHLSLAGNDLSTLRPGIFDDLSALSSLLLNSNRITELPPGAFRGLSDLAELNLRSNALRVLPQGIFAELVSLERLDLNLNEISELRPGAWSGLSRLQSLGMSGNRLIRLEPGMLVGLDQLDSLSIGGRIATIANATFSSLGRLSYLSVETVDFSQIEVGTEGSPSIKSLHVYANEATGLRPGMFIGLPGLLNLGLNTKDPIIHSDRDSLAWSQTLSWRPNAETPLENPDEAWTQWGASDPISDLGSDPNQLTRIDDDFFAGVMDLEYLWMHLPNQEVELSQSTFRGLPRLKMIWLISAGLAPLPDDVFSGLSNLEQLAIDHESGGRGVALRELPQGVFDDLQNLRLLWVREGLTELDGSVVEGLSGLEYLWFSSNLLTSLPAGVFHGLQNLWNLDLRGNPGTPFPLSVSVERTDTTDRTAAGPAKIVVTVMEAAPHETTVGLSGPGAILSADVASIPPGQMSSDTITVTRDPEHQGSVVLSLRDASDLPPQCVRKEWGCFRGLYISIGDAITLFR